MLTKLSWGPTLGVAWVDMVRHVTSRNQGTFSKQREYPGNEVGYSASRGVIRVPQAYVVSKVIILVKLYNSRRNRNLLFLFRTAPLIRASRSLACWRVLFFRQQVPSCIPPNPCATSFPEPEVDPRVKRVGEFGSFHFVRSTVNVYLFRPLSNQLTIQLIQRLIQLIAKSGRAVWFDLWFHG